MSALNVTGEHAGKKACLYCSNGGNPVAVVFAREATPAVAKLLKQLDDATVKNAKADMGSYAVFCSDKDGLDKALTKLAEYRALIALRRSSDALAHGGMRYVHVADDAIAYVRESRKEQFLCLAARAPHRAIEVPFGELETLYGEDARDGVLPNGGPAFHVWRVVRR